MKTKLKLKLKSAINDVIEDNCEDGLWDGYIHETLVQQMANAAEQVFDSSMAAQEFMKREGVAQ